MDASMKMNVQVFGRKENTQIESSNNQHVNKQGYTLFDAANSKIFRELLKRRSVWFRVQGHDSSLPVDEMNKALTDHFRSCGRILKIDTDHESGSVYLLIDGLDTVNKMLKFDGSEMRGCKLVVEHIPEQIPITPEWGSVLFGSSTTPPAKA